MMNMIGHILSQDATIVTTTTDKHGDQVLGEETAIKCRFRYITQVDRNVNQEAVRSAAIIWFSPDAPVVEGTIIGAEGAYWRVQQLVKARRMRGSTVEFLKAFVDKHAA